MLFIIEKQGRLRFKRGLLFFVHRRTEVVLIGAYCKHKVSVPAREEAARVGVPVIVCSSAGLGAFREAVEKLRGQLEKAI